LGVKIYRDKSCPLRFFIAPLQQADGTEVHTNDFGTLEDVFLYELSRLLRGGVMPVFSLSEFYSSTSEVYVTIYHFH
jgi:hypothetical protein